METLEILGYKRDDLKKSEMKSLRNEGHIPCVLYGKDELLHFYAPAIQFRELVYTLKPHFVDLNIEGDQYKAIKQQVQTHPVNDSIMHVDFLKIKDGQTIKMEIPVEFEGSSKGVIKGGRMVVKLSTLTVKTTSEQMPEKITVNIAKLDLGQSVRIKDLEQSGYEILNPENNPIITVEVPRGLSSTGGGDDEGEEETATAAEEAGSEEGEAES